MIIEKAKKSDASSLAYLINIAGEGIPYYLWSSMALSGKDPLEIGAERASREEGGFSYKNTHVIAGPDGVLGMMLAYRLEDPYEIGDLEAIPEVVRPLVLLEAKVPGSLYINAIATMESARGKGIATRLLREAEVIGVKSEAKLVSLIVASENTTAKKLYTSLGYRVLDSRPVIRYKGNLHGGNWELMIKEINAG